MSVNGGTIQRYWDLCWNERRTDLVGEVFAATYLHGRSEATPAEHAEIITETVAAFPDLRIEVVDLEDRDAIVITRTRFVGTHGGEIFGLAATGRQMTAPSLDVFFFAGARVQRLWHLFDHLPILRGIGAEVRIGAQVADLG